MSVFMLINMASSLSSQLRNLPQNDKLYVIKSTELNFPFASFIESDLAEF